MKLFNEYTLREAIAAAFEKGDPDTIIEAVKMYHDAMKLDIERHVLEQKSKLQMAICIITTVMICAVAACIFLW